MKTFARRIRVRQTSRVRNTSGFGRQHVRLSIPRGVRTNIKVRQG